MLAEDDEREGRKREEFKQVEPDAEEPVFKRQPQDQDYFEDSSYKPVVPDRVANLILRLKVNIISKIARTHWPLWTKARSFKLN
uniref:hypothetical protein n=1 Tax=Serratia proteamaculans TaxID=28151 RepID=UPI001F4C1ABC|nr:hypothetical protein [Serratia proteamaculans]ULG18504.1 hypothetical protein Man4p2_00034 [Serratia proteamaculans]